MLTPNPRTQGGGTGVSKVYVCQAKTCLQGQRRRL